jgi:cation diffusion facilitator CzcD-associated flavoprotein CzcO
MMPSNTIPSPNNAASVSEQPLRFIVIGAGLSGVMSAIKLQRAGFTDITVYEKAERLGGTWRDNTYPGIACDIPSHFYSYSFAPNPDWSRRYSPGSEIQAYIENVARSYGVDKLIRYSEGIARCEFSDGRWHLETHEGHRDVADVVIAATGVLHQPSIPDLPGLKTFTGTTFHSAKWNHGASIDGKRVGVIGSGSSSVQIVSALVDRVAHLTLFQRTAQWIMPQENPAFSDADKAKFRAKPEVMQHIRMETARRFRANFSDAVIDANSPQLKVIEDTCRDYLESQVSNLVLREQLRPNHRAACKRLVISPDFYQAIQRPHAELVTSSIEAVEPPGIRTRGGGLHELDVLILATGFKADSFVRPMVVVGRNGKQLNEYWSKRPSAYLCVTIPDMPNLFMLNGPSSPVGNYPLIEVAELQMDYALQLIELLRTQRCREITPSEAATVAFNAERVAATKNTIWVTGCNSWYMDDQGIPSAWPFSIDRFYAELSAPDLEAYELR